MALYDVQNLKRWTLRLKASSTASRSLPGLSKTTSSARDDLKTLDHAPRQEDHDGAFDELVNYDPRTGAILTLELVILTLELVDSDAMAPTTSRRRARSGPRQNRGQGIRRRLRWAVGNGTGFRDPNVTD